MKLNDSHCENVSVDLSLSSLRITTHRELLVALVTISSLIAIVTVVANILIMVALSRKRLTGNATTGMNITGLSSNARLLMTSFSFVHTIVGGFCMPMAIVQMIGNGEWDFGSNLCTIRTLIESLAEMVGIYHVTCMSIDMYIAVCKPLKYRLMTTRYGYAILISCWAIPIAVFASPNLIGGYRKGKEEIFECLILHQSCITIYGKDGLLLALALIVAIPFCTIWALYILVLRQIIQFYRTRLKTQSLITCTRATLKSENMYNNSNTKSQTKISNRNNPIDKQTDQYIITLSDISNHTSHNIAASNSKQERGKRELSSNPELTRIETKKLLTKWKALIYVISIATWHCLHSLAIIICLLYFAYNPSNMPVWSVLTVSWFCYLNSLVNLMFYMYNKNVRYMVWNVFK